jgi:hypothetical protein
VEILIELVAELKERAEIRQPEELEVFNSLRLSMVVLVEILLEVLVEVLMEFVAELVAELVVELVWTELVRIELLVKLLEVKASLVVYCLGSSIS